MYFARPELILASTWQYILVFAALPAFPKTILAESRDEWRTVVPPSTKHNFAGVAVD
jgi:hypothetical protein